ncbi:MAG: BrnT family toxin [Ignavibacteriae bacterium]|nr:BrnT family toxin [Ignavibacteriota bacterium]
MRFEWDENKNEVNIKKHSIAFEDAAKVFFNKRIVKPSNRKNEKLFITIGEVNNHIVTIAYTLRDNKIRIISARKARENEEKEYYSI